MDTNATNIEHVQSWLHDTSFNHINKIVDRCPCHVHKKISIPKRTMNGNIATITSIFFDMEKKLQQ
jgi:hypothetical protein